MEGNLVNMLRVVGLLLVVVVTCVDVAGCVLHDRAKLAIGCNLEIETNETFKTHPEPLQNGDRRHGYSDADKLCSGSTG